MEKAAWLLTLVFFALKVAGVADISWWFVVAPVLINYAIAVVLILLLLLLRAIGSSNRRSHYRW